MTQANEPVRLKLFALLAFVFAASLSALVALPQVAMAGEAPKVEARPSTLTAGVDVGSIELTSASTNFESNPSSSYFTFQGQGVEGMSVTEGGTGNSQNTTITVSGAPMTQGKITLNIDAQAFSEDPDSSATVQLTVVDPSITAALEGGSLTAGTRVSGQKIKLTINGGGTLAFNAATSGASTNFELTGDGANGLTIEDTGEGNGSEVTLTLSGTPEKAGPLGVTAKSGAFESAPSTSGGSVVATSSITVAAPDITMEADPATVTQGDGTTSFTLKASNGIFNSSSGTTNFSIGGATGAVLESVTANGENGDATLTLSTAPLYAGDMTITADPAAFKYQPNDPVTATVTVNSNEMATTAAPTISPTTVMAQKGNSSAIFTVTNASSYVGKQITVKVYSGSNFEQEAQGVTGTYADGQLTLTFSSGISTQQTYQVTFQANGENVSPRSATLTVNPHQSLPSPSPNPNPNPNPNPDNPGTTDPGTPSDPNAGNVGWDTGDGSGTETGDVGAPDKLIDAIQDAEPGTDITVNLPTTGEDLTFESSAPVPTDVKISGIILGFPESATEGTVKTVYNPTTKVFTLTATPDEGYEFVSWTYSGDMVSSDNPWMAEMKMETSETLSLQASSSQPSEVDAGGYVATFAQAEPEPATYEPVYRLYNPYDHLHLYTSDTTEIASLKNDGWEEDFNGEPCWYAPLEGSEDAAYEVVRLYNPYSHDHYFVEASDTNQINQLTALGWQQESSASSIWSAADTDTNVEVYTLFNPYNQVDTHLYTANQTEVDTLVKPDGWEMNTPIIWGVPAPEAE